MKDMGKALIVFTGANHPNNKLYCLYLSNLDINSDINKDMNLQYWEKNQTVDDIRSY